MSSNNGHRPAGTEVIATLRAKPRNTLLVRGFGPLVAAVVLFLLMLWLAPSVAPEHVVEKPVNQTATTATTATTTVATPTTVAGN
jgi:hypothetical protein